MKETAHTKARQIWDDRMGALGNIANNWRLISLGLLISNILLVAALIWLPSRTKLIPYVVEIDKNAQIQNVMAAQASSYKPSEAHVIYGIRHFLYNARSMSTDKKVLRDNWTKAYSALSTSQAKRFQGYITENKLVDKAGKISKTIDAGPVLSLGAGKFQVGWSEKTYNKDGSLESTEKYKGIFGVIHSPPKNDKELLENPLGFYINHFDWRRS